MDTFGEILWLRVPSNGQECEKFLAVAMHGHPKNSPNMVNIYIKLLEIQCWTRFQHSNDDLAWFKEVIDLGFRRILSKVVIFGWPVINNQFFTLLIVKNFDVPYFEVKHCYKLSNKDICMLFNIPKQLKLMEIEGLTI